MMMTMVMVAGMILNDEFMWIKLKLKSIASGREGFVSVLVYIVEIHQNFHRQKLIISILNM